MRPRTFIRRHRGLLRELALATDALRAGDDPEALHALRVASRRLRALHQPLAGRRRHDRLAAAAGDFLAVSGSLRDSEVLLADLETHAAGAPARRRRRLLQTGQAVLLAGPELAALAAVPRPLKRRQLPGRRKLQRRRRQLLRRMRARLLHWLDAPEADMHHLRLAVKKLRYLLEQGSKRERAAAAPRYDALVAAQAVLGDWHDRCVWIALAGVEKDLQPQLARWRRERAARLRRLRPLLAQLRVTLV